MSRLILIGGGGHCKAAIDVIEAQGVYEISGVLEKPEFTSDQVLGYPVLGSDHDLEAYLHNSPNVLVTIGQIGISKYRAKLFLAAEAAGATLPAVISPHAHVSQHAVVGIGTIVMHGVVVNSGACVGRNCIINTMSLVEHDVVIGDHSHISTGARINGDATIGSGCFVGSGAVIGNGIQVGDSCVIGAGRLVLADVIAGSTITKDHLGY